MEVLSFSLRVGVVFCYPLGASSFRYFEEHSFGEKVARSYCDLSIYIYRHIYRLGAGGLPMALEVGYCQGEKIAISLWRNVGF